MRERGWGTLSTKDWRKGILPRNVNKQARQAGEAQVGVVVCAQQPGVGKLMRVAEGGKLHRREGKTHFPCELRKQVLCNLPHCAWKGESL
jgi:hypothetical protein